MKILLCVTSLVFTASFTYSQTLVEAWTHTWGNPDTATAPSIAVDEIGNTYVAGSFKGTIDFEPGIDTTVFTSGFGGLTSDSYIAKFDSTGQFLWIRHLASTQQHFASEIVYDRDGYIYIAGYFSGTSDFDPGPEVFNLTSGNFKDDMYILKLDRDGNFVWAITTQGDGNKYVGGISLDDDGNLLVGGIFNGTADFDPTPLELSYTATSEINDVYFLKYSDAGTLIWAKAIFGNHRVGVTGVDVDAAGNAYFVGIFDDRRDFDPGVDTIFLQAFGPWDAWVLKLNPLGNFQWLKRLGNDGENFANDIAVSDNNELFITGHFSAEMDFDQGNPLEILTATNSDPYIWKMDHNGEYKWAGQFRGAGFDQGNNISIDSRGDLYVTGFFADTVDFDPGPGTHYLTSTGDTTHTDAFVVRLHPDGQFVWAHQAGGLDNDAAGEVQLDPRNNIYVTGGFKGTAGFFLDNTQEDSLVSAGSVDVFLTRWHQCLESYASLDTVACNQAFVSPSGKYIWTKNGTYQDTIENKAGCDSIMTISLYVLTISPEVVVIGEGAGLSSVVFEASFQWLDCENGLNPIPGETNQEFFPQVSGTYAVMIDFLGCIVTSECINFIVTGVEETDQLSESTLYPNPTNEGFSIQLPSQMEEVLISVHSVTGQAITEKRFTNTNTISIEDQFQPGIYYVHLNAGPAGKVFKLIVF